MSGIFISYRRKDTAGHAGHLKADLGRRFGRESVFMDIDSIPAGQEYADPIHHALSRCRVALVLIGDEWLTRHGGGEDRRIDEEEDWVRREVAAALRRGDVTVIPVLVERTHMPGADELPSDIARLSGIQATELRNRQWEYDVEKLCKTMERVVARGRIKRFLRRLPRWAKLGVAVALAALAGLVAFLVIQGGSDPSRDPPQGFQLYEASGYSAFYPEGWTVSKDDVPESTYRETQFVSPSQAVSVLIDWTPGETIPPLVKARQVEEDLRKEFRTYKRLSMRRVELDGTPAAVWVYSTDGERKTDVLISLENGGYAVLGEGADHETAREMAMTIAGSIEPL
jgi:hypothetical protein